jgi:Uma2 family endonuclease
MRSVASGWNRARWEQLPEDGNRYEVIDGVLYMSTAPRFFHQWIVRQALFELHRRIDDLGIGTTIMAPIGVFMPGCDPVQPDVVVMLANGAAVLRDGRIEGPPALLVEVQSPSSVGYDDGTKRRAYARAGVPEYWIARPSGRDVLVCSEPDAARGDYARSRVFAAGEELVSATLPVRFSVDSLFAGAPDTTL